MNVPRWKLICCSVPLVLTLGCTSAIQLHTIDVSELPSATSTQREHTLNAIKEAEESKKTAINKMLEVADLLAAEKADSAPEKPELEAGVSIETAATKQMRVTVTLDAIAILQDTKMDPNNNVELTFLSSYQEVAEPLGPVVSSFEPQKADFYRLSGEASTNGNIQRVDKGSLFFNGPVTWTSDTVLLSFYAEEIDELSNSARKRIKSVYDKMSGTSQLALEKDTLSAAVSTPALSYIPIVWSIYELVLAITDASNSNDSVNESPTVLRLSRKDYFRPSEKEVNNISLAVDFEKPAGTITCNPDGKCPVGGKLVRAWWSFTKDIKYREAGGVRLYLTVVVEPIPDKPGK